MNFLYLFFNVTVRKFLIMSVAHVMAYFMFLLNNNGLDNAMKEKFNSYRLQNYSYHLGANLIGNTTSYIKKIIKTNRRNCINGKKLLYC